MRPTNTERAIHSTARNMDLRWPEMRSLLPLLPEVQVVFPWRHCARSRYAVQPRNDGLHAYVPSSHAFVFLVSMHCLSPAGRTSKQAVLKRWADVPPRVYDEKDDSPRSPRHAPPLPRCSPPRARPASEQAARPRTAAEVVAAVTADVGPRPGTTPAARPTICFDINGAADADEDDRREAKVRALRGTSRHCGVLVGTAGY